jgi:hypothetical protein
MHNGPFQMMGPVKNGVFYFFLFFNETLFIRLDSTGMKQIRT